MSGLYIELDMMPNQVQTNLIVGAMESMGLLPEQFKYHLVGCYDAPCGWIIVGASPIEEEYGRPCFEDGEDEKYLILGDLFDVLPGKSSLLGLDEVVKFAAADESRLAAVRGWKLFRDVAFFNRCATARAEGEIRDLDEIAAKRKGTGDGRRVTVDELTIHLHQAFDFDSARLVAEDICDDVNEDLEYSADEEWSDGDLMLAVGRTVVRRLGLEV